MISIVLYLWGKTGPHHRYHGLMEYGPDHVAKMAAGVRKHLRRAHEIVVVSDWPAEHFDSSLRYVPLQDHFGEIRKLGGCYLRLRGLAADMAPVLGDRCAWIDLDSVIVGELDSLFADDKAPLKLLKLDSVPGTPWNGSAVMWSPQQTDWLWQGFDPAVTPRQAHDQGFKGTDQAVFSLRCGPLTPHWDYRDGILHFDLHCGRRRPEHARIITFPGRLKPGTPFMRGRRATWLDEVMQDGEAAAGLTPWAGVSQKPVSRRAPRPTMQDLRRAERSARKQAAINP